MELRRLRYFVAVAEELHFRRAAERVHVTQPVISEQVHKLEQELGVRLLRRSSHDVQLTPAGAALLEQARSLLRQTDHIERLARLGRMSTQHLRVGHPADLLPPAIGRALAGPRRQGIELLASFTVDAPRALLDAVRQDRLDVAVVPLPAAVSGFHCTELCVEAAAVAVWGQDHPATPTLHELARHPVAMLARELDPAFFDSVAAGFRTREIPVTLVPSAAPAPEQLLLEVAATGMPAILPSSVAARCSVEGVELRSLGAAAPRTRVVVVTREHASDDAVRVFLDTVTRQRQRASLLRAVPA